MYTFNFEIKNLSTKEIKDSILDAKHLYQPLMSVFMYVLPFEEKQIVH